MRKQIGKIRSISFGMGGYQDVCLGLSVTLGSEKECWGVSDFKGTWSMEPDKYCKWTREDQDKIFSETVRLIGKLLKDAKVSSIDRLIDVPVEVSLDGNLLKEWRILTEVI